MVFRLIVATVALVLCTDVSARAAGGADVFKSACAKCHGETGMSDTTVGKAMKVPHLVGDAEVDGKSVADVVAAIKENAKHPPAVKSMSDADLAAAAEHAKSLAVAK